jgi:hypothetical protein
MCCPLESLIQQNQNAVMGYCSGLLQILGQISLGHYHMMLHSNVEYREGTSVDFLCVNDSLQHYRLVDYLLENARSLIFFLCAVEI